MNTRSFKTVFSKHLGALVAVGEHASSQGKANGAGAGGGFGGFAGFVGTLTVGFALVGLAWAGPVTTALPTGGQVAQGVASISQSGAVMNISQSSAKAVVNWNSFDIGAGAKVNIVQPGADAVMLNRVTGANPSQILGQLNANGQVVLVNPNGVLFGKDGSVNAISFTASTLGISDANFMAGNRQFDRNGSTASVVNQGSIKATGGYVALLGASVTNEGKIETQGGTAYLAAAETVKVPVSGSGRIKLELSPSSINAAVSNSKDGTIVTQGGQVYMQAAALNSAVASIIQSGSIDTTGEQGGAVHLLADGGDIKVDGSITANSTGKDDKGQQRKGGDIVIGRDEDTSVLATSTDVGGAKLESGKGFVETSGHLLDVDKTAVKAATWLLDPDNIDITNAATATSGYSKVAASDVSTALNAGANVVIHTTNGVSTSTGSIGYTASNPGEGNILVSSSIAKTSGGDASLTLTADNGLTVNAGISSSGAGTGKLDISLTANGKTNGTAVASMTVSERALSRGLFINAVALNANGGNITLTGTSYADAAAYNASTAPNGNVNAASTNAIGKGVQIHNGVSLAANNITIAGAAQNQRIQTGVDASNNPVYYTETSYGVVFQRYPTQATLTASGNILVTGTLQGAGNGNGLIFAESGWGAQAPSMTATGNITLRGNNRASTSNTSAATRITSGIQAVAGGNIVLQAETNNVNANAIYVYSANAATWGNALYGNMTLQATGNVLIQSNQGSIVLSNLLPNNLANGALTSESKITGVNITVDNTGAGMATGAGTTVTGSGGTQGASLGSGSINAATGGITKGVGMSYNNHAINLADSRAVTATGNVNIYGVLSPQPATAAFYGVRDGAMITASNLSIQGSGDNTGAWSAAGGGIILINGASIVGTASTGTNLIQGTWNSAYGSQYAIMVGDSGSSNVSITSATQLNVQGTNNQAGQTVSGTYATPGILSQGTVTTSGVVNLTGAAKSYDAINLNGTWNHSGGTLIITGTANTTQVTSNAAASGIKLNGTLKVTDSSNLTLNGTYSATVANTAGTTGYGVFGNGAITGTGGQLSVTGQSILVTGGVTGSTGIYTAGAITGWGNTTLLAQNAGGSASAALNIANNINVGSNQLSILANGGQIYQGSSSTLTASRITMDNTGAGRTSLFADTSGSPNASITNGQSFGGSVDAAGKVTMGTAATTSSSITRGLDLNGAMTIGGDINLANNSGAYINSALTSSAGDINVQAKLDVTVAKALSASTASGATGGNVSLKSNTGNIALNATTTAGKTLSLDAEGVSSTVTQTAALSAAGLELLGPTASYTLTNASNAVSYLVGNTGSVNYVNNAALTISQNNSAPAQWSTVTGLTTTGNITLSGTTTAHNSSGVWVAQAVSSTGGGNISITGTSSTTGTTNTDLGVRIGANIGGANTGTISITGTSSLETGIYMGGGTISSPKKISLTGTGILGVSLNGGSITLLAGGADFAGTDAIALNGNTTSTYGFLIRNAITNNSTNGATTLKSTTGRGWLDTGGSITNAATAGAINVAAGDGTTSSTASIEATANVAVTQNANADVVFSSDGQGSVTPAKIIKNGTGAGNVVIAAGKLVAAGTATGGQVTPVSGNSITNSGTGKIYVYSGSTSATGDLTLLSASLSTLDLEAGLAGAGSQQTAQTNVAYNGASLGIAGSTASVQALFRGKVAFSDTLAGVTLTKTYGNANTGQANIGNVWVDVKAQLKLANTGNMSTTASGGTFRMSKASVIDGITATSLQSPTYSGSNYLNASTYSYSALGASISTATWTSTGTVSLVINKADLTLSGTRVYDRGTTYAGQYLTATGVNGETFTVTGSGDSSNLSTKNVQTGSLLNSVTGLSLGTSSNGGLSSNYNALRTTGSSVNVTTKSASVSATATNVTYSGVLQTQSNYTSSGLITGDTITISGVASGTNFGTYASNMAVSGADASNYSISLTNANLVIAKANLTLSGTRVYDAGKTFAGAYLTATGVNGETFSVTGVGDSSNLASKNVQANQVLASVTGLSLGTSSNGGLSTNYNALSVTGSSVSVTAKAASINGTSTNLTYNGATQTQSAATTSGLEAGDIVTVGGLASGKNAGTYASNLSVSGADIGNYSFTYNNANLVIGKASLTATANSSVVTYNGASQSVSGFTVAGLLGSDQPSDLTGISASGASGTNAGTYTSTMQSAAQTNYTVSTVNGSLQINKAALTATGNSASVTYNGLDQTVTGFTVSGLQGSDTQNSLSSIQAAGVTGKNAGSYTNTVTAGTETNYTVTTANGTLTIGKASLTATGNSANVTYSGVSQSVSGYTLSGLLGSDTAADITHVLASGASGTNVGSYANTVTVGTETNYTVTAVNGALQVGKANLMLSGTRVYDAGTTFAGSNLTATGVHGETFSVTGLGDNSNLASKNVQAGQTLASVTGLVLGTSSNGGLSGNYNALSTTGSSVSVTAKAASVTGVLTNVVYNGTSRIQTAANTSGFIGSDIISVSGLATGKDAGTYASSLSVGGADAGNYNVTYTNANLVIAQAPLTVTANAVTKTYDGGLGASGAGSVAVLAGAAAGDVVNSAGSQAFLNKDAGTNKTVRASGVTIKDAGGHDVTGNYAITYADNLTSTINQAPLTITANNDARFVTQADGATFNGVSYSGFVGGETASALTGTLSISRTNALTDVAANTYTGVLVPTGLSSSNYNIAYANGNYTIVPANRLLIDTSNVSVTYGSAPTYITTAKYMDGSNVIHTLTQTGSGGNYTFSDGVGGSVAVALKPYVGNALAGTSTSGNIVVGNYDIKDANPTVVGSNFVGSPVFVGTLAVNAKAVTPSATGVSKTYDSTTSMNNVVVGLSGKETGDSLSISGTGAFSQRNAGTSLSYTISGVTLGSADAGNYYLSGGTNSFTGNDGVITAAPLVVSTSNVSKTYDRTTSAAGVAVAVQGTQLFNGDTLSGGTYAFTNANAGIGNKVVTVSGVTVNDGNGGANYSVTYANNTTSTINPKALTASFSASNKTYNGNTVASVTGSSSDVMGADAVNFVSTSATFANKNVGTGKMVTVSGISLSGADAGNYSLQNTTATTSANITAKALTASFSTSSRAYDGTTNATVAGSSADMVAGDSISYSSTASFATADAGSGKVVNISGISLGGTDGGNYALQNTSATSSGTITPRDVSLTALTAANKTYDGTVSATITGGTIATGVTGETLSVTGSGAFANKNAGTGKQVTVSDVSALTKVNGTGNWNNYNLTTTGSLGTTANIAQAALTVTANGVNKAYDATLSASGTGTVGTLAGAGDAVSSSGSQAYLDKNAGTAKVVRASGVTIKDANNADMTGNYQITYVDSLTGAITQAPLQLGVNDVSKTYDGTLAASATAVVRSGTVYAGDSLSGGSFAFTSKNYGVGNKTVTVSGVTVGDGTNTGNYAVTYVNNTTSTINKAALTVTATGVTKTYDGTLSASGTATVGTLVTGDVVNSAGSQAYLDANAGTGKTVRATGVTIKDAGNADMSGNYQVTYQDVNTGVINKAALTATLVGSVSKEYDGTTAASNLTGANYSVTGWATVGEGVTVNHTAATYASAAVVNNGGTGSVSTTLQASDFAAVGSTNLSNYTLPTSATGLVGTITAAPLTVKVNNTTMFVTQAPGTAVDNGFTFTGLKNGESAATVLGALTRSYTGAVNPATGSYSGVYDLTAVPTAANYAVTVQKGDLTVVAADKLLINVGSANATYGALTAANAGSGASSVTAQYCLVSSNCNGANIANLNMSNSGTRWTATDSSNSTISFNTVVDTTGKLSTGGFVNTGNYTFGVDSLSTTGTVNFNGTALNSGVLTVDPKVLGLSAGAVTKVYDGTTALAGMALMPSGGLNGDLIQVSSTGGSFMGKNAGSQGFTLTGLQLQGTDKANYAFAANTVTGTGTITPKALTLSATALDKVYDGNTSASVGGLSLSGVIAGDAVSASGGSASFADKNVARDVAGHVVAKSVSISGVTLAGADAGNYTVDPNAGATARITPLTVSASVTASDKVYDGSANASVVGRVNGLIGTDSVSAVSANSFFASKNVARNAEGQLVSQTVTVAGLSLTGADAVNYSLSNTTATSSATITPKTLQASGAVADKVYDGSAQASLAGLNGTGIVAGDAVTVQATSAAFEDKNVARDASGHVVAKTVTVTGLSLSGANAGNYELQGSSFTTQAQILPRALSLVALAQDKSYDGTAMATGSVSATNLVPGDAVQLSWAGGEFASKDVSRNAQGHVQAQAVSFGNVQISGADVGNYSLDDSTAKAIATIMPKVLTVTGTWVADKQEDGNTSAKVTMGLLSGLVGQEQLLVTAAGNFQSAAAGSDKSVDVNYSLQDGANGGKSGNYTAPLQVFKANILATGKNNPVQPIVVPSKPASSSKVVIANAQAAVGRSDTESKNEIRQECSFLHPEKCECQDTAVVGVQLCVAPAPTEARGIDLTDRLNAVLGLPAK